MPGQIILTKRRLRQQKSLSQDTGDTQSTLVPPINTDDCGVTKGCYRHPKDCPQAYCYLIVTWVDHGDYVTFELGADGDGWVALGFSYDKKMVRLSGYFEVMTFHRSRQKIEVPRESFLSSCLLRVMMKSSNV